jgi:hypothetical protein
MTSGCRRIPSESSSWRATLEMGHAVGAPGPAAAPARHSMEAPQPGAHCSRGHCRLPPQEGVAVGGAAPAPRQNDTRGLRGEFPDGLGRPLCRRAPPAGDVDSGEGRLHCPYPDVPRPGLCVPSKF